MTYHPSLPWPQIHEFLLKIGQTDQPLALCKEAVLELNRLISYDSAYIFLLNDQSQLADNQVIGAPEKKIKEFIDYYVTIDPCKQRTPPNAKTWTIDWNEFQNTEFHTDWGRQVDLSFTSSMYLHNQKHIPGAIMFITRSGHHGFNDRDLALWEVVQSHLSTYFKLIDKLTPTALSVDFFNDSRMTKRENEIAEMLCRGLSITEICSLLVTSKSDLHRHLNNIFIKMKVSNRMELVKKILEVKPLGKNDYPLMDVLIKHPDPEVRRRIIIPLAEIGDLKALNALGVLEKDPSAEVAQLAQNVLFRVNNINTEGIIGGTIKNYISFKTLGPFLISKDDTELASINWRTAKSRDLLAFLLHQGKPVSKDLILEELWPEYDLEKAQSLFHTVLYYLRQILKNIEVPELIVYRNAMYSLQSGFYFDERQQFQEMTTAGLRSETDAKTACDLLERAISLYHGDYLAELDYPWLLPLREKLRNLYCEALLKVAGCCFDEADYQRAINHLLLAIEINPYLEEPYRLLMKTYAAFGDRNMARQIYQKLSTLLKEELGIDPSSETVALYEKLTSSY